MKFTTTYGDLNNRLIELDNIKANSNTLYCMMAGRIESFHRQNGYNIKMLREGMKSLFELHVQKNEPDEQSEKGLYKFQKITGEVNGVPQEQTAPVFIDSDHAGQYKKDFDKLMATQFNIIFY